MNRDEAEKALSIIRSVIQNTRDDLVAHNWGLAWMIHAFANLGACLAGAWIESQGLPVFWYLVPLAIDAVVNLAIVLLLVQRDQGVRSYVEWQLHGIWCTFIAFTVAGAVVLTATPDVPPRLFGSLFALTSGISFVMMGVVFSRQLPYGLALLAITLLGPFLPAGVQWILIGLTWWCAQFFTGLSMHREKRQRAEHESATKLL